MNGQSPPGSTQRTPNPGRPGRVWAFAGIVSGVLALGILPILFGPLGVVLGLVGYVKGSRRTGVAAVVAGVLGLVLGIILTAFLLSISGQVSTPLGGSSVYR